MVTVVDVSVPIKQHVIRRCESVSLKQIRPAEYTGTLQYLQGISKQVNSGVSLSPTSISIEGEKEGALLASQQISADDGSWMDLLFHQLVGIFQQFRSQNHLKHLTLEFTSE